MNKDDLEITSSILWFSMDAMWLFSAVNLAYILAVPTLIASVLMVTVEKNPEQRWIDISSLCWVLMNIGWLVGDEVGIEWLLNSSKVVFFLGILAIIRSLSLSKDWRMTLSNFRRFKIKKSHEKIHSFKH